ncbi:MAG: C69 family dipeptidase [Bacteroidales bacterium]|nr:C69 family dipeptidase [Bacteroidales bacterium]
MSNLFLVTLLSFGIIAGSKATTDGYVYLGHNEDIRGDKMLNIYNVPGSKDGLAGLWFEFPGRIGDSYVNGHGVCIVSEKSPSREKDSGGTSLYKAQTKAFRHAKSAREAVRIIGSEVSRHGSSESGRTYLIADSKEGWVLSIAKGRIWVAQRVPDDEIMVISGRFNIQETNLKDTANFMGSKRLVRKAMRKRWYNPQRDGAFNFAKAYSNPATLTDMGNAEAFAKARDLFFKDSLSLSDAPFSSKPVKKFHRRDLSGLLSEVPVNNENTALTTIFTLNPDYPAEKGTVIWVGFPGQDAANHNQWTIFTKSPESCHRYADASMALKKHFLDTGSFRERWPSHFYWHYLYPETNIDVIPHDYTVYIPQSQRGGHDSFNDHFHVLVDEKRGLLHAFWTQGSHEAADDEKVVHASSSDGGKTWTDPVMVAGSPSIEAPEPVAAWQQPMISRSGRLYCLWNQETTVKKHLSGLMFGRYSDDGGKTWSKPEQVPFPVRFKADPEDPSIPPTWCMWQRPLRLGEDGRYIAGCSRYGTDGISRVEFWQYDNIDDDPQIKDIQISFFNTDEDSFDAAQVVNDHDYSPRDGRKVEEACLVGLPDGRLFAVMRTTIGHPIWSVSTDNGKTWSRPEILRMRDDGEPILQPCSPCPIYDCNGPEARSGEYFLMTHNTFDFNGLTAYQNRGPVYKLGGEFVPGAHQPVWFKDAGLFSPRDSGNSLYTSYTFFDGKGILWFGDQKYYLFGKMMR